MRKFMNVYDPSSPHYGAWYDTIKDAKEAHARSNQSFGTESGLLGYLERIVVNNKVVFVFHPKNEV